MMSGEGAPGWRARWTRDPRPWAALLFVLAVSYFGSYVRYSLNFRDEGGTEALLAQRLLSGERPLVDLTLGYNVLWFYPIVGLFKLFGVNYVLLRGYCFALSTVTALCGFAAVQRAGRRPWLAFLVGLMLVLVPGMTFKNYMPLLAVTNGWCLLEFALAEPARRGRWPWVGGVVLGLTYLLRIDVGIFVTGLWLGAFTLRAAERGAALRDAVSGWARGAAILLGLVVLVHAPVYLDARARGFDQPFLQQYLSWPQSIALQLRQRLAAPPPPAGVKAEAAAVSRPENETPAVAMTALLPVAAVPPVATLVATSPASGKPIGVPNQETLRRKGLAQWSGAKNADERLLIILLYLPLVSLLSLAAWAVARLAGDWRRRAPREEYAAALAALLVLGAAFTVFPQYFFFRPDSPHLSEFSPGFWVAVTSSLLLLARGARRWLVATLGTLLILHAGLYLWRMLPDRWTGTIAARKGRTTLYTAENGVRVYLSKREVEGLRGIQEIVQKAAARPDDYLIAYPYHPALNVLTNRRTYERNVYIDNATAEPGWNAHAIARLQRFRPAVVMVSDWEINGTEASRFSQWAQPTKNWIQEHYLFQGNFLEFEIYTREQIPGGKTPERASVGN